MRKQKLDRLVAIKKKQISAAAASVEAVDRMEYSKQPSSERAAQICEFNTNIDLGIIILLSSVSA